MTTLTRYRRPTPFFLRNELGRLFDELLTGPEEETTLGWSPKMDVAETDMAYEVTVDLPGVPRDQIDISMQDHRLTVRGERAEEKKEEEKNYLRIESSRGSFYRSVALPNAVEDGEIDAHYDDGVLKIEIPKAEEPKPRKIPIS